MADMVKVTVYVVVDANGDCDCGTTESDAQERYAESIGGDEMRRMVAVEIEVPFTIPVLKGGVPEALEPAVMTCEGGA